MKIYDYIDYKKFVNDWIMTQPSEGRGLFRKIASYLNVHSTLVSHIFKGQKDLSLEQGFQLSKFLELNKNETEYFLLQLNWARAGSISLKDHYRSQLEEKQEAALDLKNRIKKNVVFTEEEQGRFYSNWYFSAVRLATDLPGINTSEKIAKHLKLSESLVIKVLNFLTDTGLCIKKNDKYHIGPGMTHIEALSPFVLSHHKNWRLKALERHHDLSSTEVAFTFPVTISEADSKLLKKRIVDFIEETQKLVTKSPSEELRCLNIDWVKIF